CSLATMPYSSFCWCWRRCMRPTASNLAAPPRRSCLLHLCTAAGSPAAVGSRPAGCGGRHAAPQHVPMTRDLAVRTLTACRSLVLATLAALVLTTPVAAQVVERNIPPEPTPRSPAIRVDDRLVRSDDQTELGAVLRSI